MYPQSASSQRAAQCLQRLVNIAGCAGASNISNLHLNGVIIKLCLGLCVFGGFTHLLMYFCLP